MDVVAAAFCPQPPLLVPAVAAALPVAARAPSIAAVRWLVDQGLDRIVLLGSGERARLFPAGAEGSFSGFGVDVAVRLSGPPMALASPSASPLPLPLAVGAWLLGEVGWTGPVTALTCDAGGALPAGIADQGQLGLLVMGDGSARRTEKAPGWLDPRAGDYDAVLRKGLASGHPEELRSDLELGAQLLAAGAPAWHAAAGLLGGRQWNAKVTYDDAPYGVGYLVATWSPQIG